MLEPHFRGVLSGVPQFEPDAAPDLPTLAKFLSLDEAVLRTAILDQFLSLLRFLDTPLVTLADQARSLQGLSDDEAQELYDKWEFEDVNSAGDVREVLANAYAV